MLIQTKIMIFCVVLGGVYYIFRKMRVLFVCFLFISQWVIGQDKDARHSIRFLSGNLHGGWLQIHSSKIENFRGVRPKGAGLELSWKFVSPESYALCKCYPSLGISLNYWDFGHEALGNALSGLFYVEPVLFSPFNVDVSLKTGLGVSYLDHPYDEDSNPENVVYSTSIAFPLMAGLSMEYAISGNWFLRFSAMFQHISNGGTSQPNLGINYTTLGGGIARKLDSQTIPKSPKIEPFHYAQRDREWIINLISGLKEPEESEEKASVFGVSAQYQSQFARINGWSAGLMAELDYSRSDASFPENGRVSVLGGHHFLLGRFDFGQTAGFYLIRGHETQAPWFQYYTLDFEVTSMLGVGVGLKAHGKVAEYLGVRINATY